MPNIVDANDATFANGDEELFLNTLPTTASHSYSVVDEGASGNNTIYRLQDNYTGTAANVLLRDVPLVRPVDIRQYRHDRSNLRHMDDHVHFGDPWVRGSGLEPGHVLAGRVIRLRGLGNSRTAPPSVTACKPSR